MLVLSKKNDSVNFTGTPIRNMNWVKNGAERLEVVLSRLDVNSRKDVATIKEAYTGWKSMVTEDLHVRTPFSPKVLQGDIFAVENPATGETLGLIRVQMENGVPVVQRLAVRSDLVGKNHSSFSRIDELLIAGVVAKLKNGFITAKKLDLGCSMAYDRFVEFLKPLRIRLDELGDVNVTHQFSIPSDRFDTVLRNVGAKHNTDFYSPELPPQASSQKSKLSLRDFWGKMKDVIVSI